MRVDRQDHCDKLEGKRPGRGPWRFGFCNAQGAVVYERLDPQFRHYVDSLLAHARQALWPERRAALEGFRRGIARADDADLQLALRALGDAAPAVDDPATALYRALLTAYLEQLGESEEISNPDQAALLSESLDVAEAERARQWLEDHPEHAPAAQRAERS